jgi:hypothetical protein
MGKDPCCCTAKSSARKKKNYKKKKKKKSRQMLRLVFALSALLPAALALYQPMRVTARHYELGVIGDETAGNPVFAAQSPAAYAQLHGGVYGIVNPALPPLTSPRTPVVRQGDRQPEDTAYYTLDGSDYSSILERLRRQTNATVVKVEWERKTKLVF